MKFAVDEGDFDRYVILQGTDYPILSNSQINDFFEKYFDTEFVKGVSETDSNNNRNLHKYILKYYMDNPNVFEKLHNKVNILILKLYHGNLPKPYIKIDGIKRNIYRGWAQIALTDAAVKFVLEFHRTHGEYNEYFRHVYAADESYFHTIIYNSVFREKASGIISEEERSHKMLLNLTYFEYFDQVKVFTKKEDYEFLKNTGYLYFRKATSQSKELLDYIDYIHELL